jgi:alkanesulfonate monooxygenase SsuD/methylene tetrahydromethanopterin reductase-like flavin-dependent oxidoreductase (luciferase family)
MEALKFGLMLSNRGPVLGYINPLELVELAVRAEQSGSFDSVWSGDAFLVNPRLDAIGLLCAVAAQTSRVQLGPACMGSFTQRSVLDLAYSWASLDQISNGRSLMVACAGGGSGPAWESEARATGVAPATRRGLMWERITVLRSLWQETNVSFEGKFHTLDDVTVLPQPIRQPYPIWSATNITRLASGTAAGPLPRKTLGTIGQLCDGWMTHSVDAERFGQAWEVICESATASGRDASELDNCLCFNICVRDDSDAALDESVDFLRAYYGIAFTRERTKAWTAYGSPQACATALRAFKGSAIKRVALRITANDQAAQLERIVKEVLPLV